MIVKQVAAGAKTAGLLAYLYGPGVGEARGGTVHVNPRTVASWDGQPSVHSPKHLDSGRQSVSELARRLDAPVALATKAPAKHVGHIVVANHPDDPVLTDAQWRHIAADVMRRAGLSKGPQDPDAVRWIAVRHDDTSIHVAYTKVRESGRAAGYINYTKAWESMRHEWEERLGLTPTGHADGTARRPYGQAEVARTKTAQHKGDFDARPDTAELRHLCRVIALEVRDVDTYFARLRSAGLTVLAEPDSGLHLSGYRVGLRSRADGTPVLYAAARLDPMLTVDALSVWWSATTTSTEAKTDGQPSPTSVPAPVPTSPASMESYDLEDVLRLAADTTGDRAFFDAAEIYSSAGRRAEFTSDDGRARRPADETAHQLRTASALLGRLARLDPASGRRVEAAELALALASMLADWAAWHEHHRDRAGAVAAFNARRKLTASVNALSSSRGREIRQPAAQVPGHNVFRRPSDILLPTRR